MIGEKLIHLSDGTMMDVKINFATLYYIKNMGIDKLIKRSNRKDKNGNKIPMSERKSMELAAKIIYVILRSNGKKVEDIDEAMILVPMDADEIKDLFHEFESRLQDYKKKEQAKRNARKK